MKKHPEIDALLRSLNASVLKRYGQNFLVDDLIIQQTFAALALQPGESLLEIGPGLGALTKHVPFANHSYISYEIDRQYHAYLSKTYSVNTTHYLGNFLKATPQHVDVIIGNLPYYITSDIIEKIFKDFSTCKRGVFLVQKEVIARLVAQPGDEAYGPLAILVQSLGSIQTITDVDPTSFYPEPHVTSTLFLWTNNQQVAPNEARPFFYFLKKLFLNRRKNILNNVTFLRGTKEEKAKVLQAVGIEDNRRPESLSIQEVWMVYGAFKSRIPL